MGRYYRTDYSRRCYPYPKAEEVPWIERALKNLEPR
jgi:hypothetical protein